MKKIFSLAIEYFRRSDTVLLLLCIAASVYGIILINSATRWEGSTSYTVIQTIALLIGIFLYFIFSIIDLEIIADRWRLLLIFSVLFIGSLFIFGEAGDSGNRAWIRFGGIGVQPAEIVKIPYIILLGRLMVYLRERRGLSHPFSIIAMGALFLLMFILIIASSSDLGSALVYAFIFIVMLFVGGVKLYWFAIAIGALAAVIPYAWNHFFNENQKIRIIAPYDPSESHGNRIKQRQPLLQVSFLERDSFMETALNQAVFLSNRQILFSLLPAKNSDLSDVQL